ncbi:MAG: MFS transporter [Nocardioides sp.]|jgi:predicted MFS family arabinose efflux permease
MSRTSLWSPTFVGSALVMFGLSCNFFVLVPVTVLLVAHRYDASVAWGGAAAGALLVGAVIARPLAGPALHGRSLGAAGVGSSAVIVASSAALLLPVPIEVFIALRVLTGIAFAIGSTAALTAAVQAVHTSRRGEATGYFGLSNSLAGAVGPATGLAMAHNLGYDAAIWAVVAFGLVSLAAATFIEKPAETTGPSTGPGTGWLRFFEPRVLPLCALVILIGIPYSGLFSFIDPYVNEQGVAGGATTFYLAYSLMFVVVRPFSGRAMDRGSATRVLLPSLTAIASGVLVLSFAGSHLVMAFAGLLCGTGIGMAMAATTVVAVQLAPDQRLPQSVSTFYLFLDLSVAAGPVLLGLLLPSLGYEWLFRSLALTSACAVVLLLALQRRALLGGAAPDSDQSLSPRQENARERQP